MRAVNDTRQFVNANEKSWSSRGDELLVPTYTCPPWRTVKEGVSSRTTWRPSVRAPCALAGIWIPHLAPPPRPSRPDFGSPPQPSPARST